ncbi:MAG: O-antigen ligase family protein [Planctomycetota bacterium]|nr:O-antigen ligase family protein [Planctomycetota bacterium]
MWPTTSLIEKSPFYLASAALAGALVLCTAMGFYIGIAVVLGSVWALAITLHMPVLMLMAWIATGPLLSGWLGTALGDSVPALTPDRVLIIVVAGVSAVRWLGRPARFQKPGAIEGAMGVFIGIAFVSMVASGGSPGIGGGVYPFQPTRYAFAGARAPAMGVFASPIEFGYCMSTGLIIVLVLWMRTRSAGLRLVLAGLALPMMVAIVLAKSRAPWIGLALGAAVVSVYDPQLRRAIIAVGVAGAVALVAAAVILPQVMDTREFEARVTEVSPILNRIALTATSVNMIAARPLFGWGFYRIAFVLNKPEYISNFGGIPARFSDPGVPHNEFMHILVLLGIVGFVPFMAIIVFNLRMLLRVLRALPVGNLAADDGAGAVAGERPEADLRRVVALIALATLVMYLFNGLSVDIALFLHATNQVYVLLGAVAGMALAAATPAASGAPGGDEVRLEAGSQALA